jgi:hypothetical protein
MSKQTTTKTVAYFPNLDASPDFATGITQELELDVRSYTSIEAAIADGCEIWIGHSFGAYQISYQAEDICKKTIFLIDGGVHDPAINLELVSPQHRAAIEPHVCVDWAGQLSHLMKANRVFLITQNETKSPVEQILVSSRLHGTERIPQIAEAISFVLSLTE